MNEKSTVVGAIDVGSPKNTGWAILDDAEYTGTDLDEFIEVFARRAQGRPCALGFEAPLFIPCQSQFARLTAQRVGEKGRPWSAGAGATVTTIGLATMVYVLGKLRPLMPATVATLDWKAWPKTDHLLVFEAFVSGQNHAGPGEHSHDALTAATGFQLAAMGDLDDANAVTGDEVLSLAGACLARTAWCAPTAELLRQACLVIRPVERAGGPSAVVSSVGRT